jgi:hypothetical protein
MPQNKIPTTTRYMLPIKKHISKDENVGQLHKLKLPIIYKATALVQKGHIQSQF